MKLPDPKAGGSLEDTPAGNHIAVCYRIVDLGTQERRPYQGQPKAPCRKISFGWELPYTKMSQGENAGKPFTFHETYNVFTGPNANFRMILEAWRGETYRDEDIPHVQIAEYLYKPCMLNLERKEKDGKVYTNLLSIAPLPDGIPTPSITNPLVYFDLDDFDRDVFEGFSDKLKTWIALSPEYGIATGKPVAQLATVGAAPQGINTADLLTEDDIPF